MTDHATTNADGGGRDRRGDALEHARRYFGHLASGDLEAAAACFTDDVYYSHPPYRDDPTTDRRIARGRVALAEMFSARGRIEVEYRVESCAVFDDHCFIEGTYVVASTSTEGSFLSSIRLADDGRFSSYVAYLSEPPAHERG